MLAGQNCSPVFHQTTGCSCQSHYTSHPSICLGVLNCPVDKCQGKFFKSKEFFNHVDQL